MITIVLHYLLPRHYFKGVMACILILHCTTRLAAQHVGVGTLTPTATLHVRADLDRAELINEDFEAGIGAFVNAGLVNWTTTDVHPAASGTHSLTSNFVFGTQNALAILDVQVPDGSNAELTFYHHILVNPGPDAHNHTEAQFRINGDEQFILNENQSWTEMKYYLSSGAYTLEWEASHRSGSSDDTLEYILDDVVVAYNQNPTLRIVDGTEGMGKLLISDKEGYATWRSLNEITAYDNEESHLLPMVLDGAGQVDTPLTVINGLSTGVQSRYNEVGFMARGNLLSGFFAKNNLGSGFHAMGNQNDGFQAQSNSGVGFRSKFNTIGGFAAENNPGYGFLASGNSSHGFVADSNSGNGIHAIDNSGHGFLADSNSGSGFLSRHNDSYGFHANENSANGFYASNNSGVGFRASNNTSYGFRASSNDNNGFHATANTGHGYHASGNTVNGFNAESNQKFGFRAQYNDFAGFSASFNDTDGFQATSNTNGYYAFLNSGNGVLSTSNGGYGYLAFGNNTGGFYSSTNTGYGFHALANEDGGFHAENNSGSGFRATDNVWGFFAIDNLDYGFRARENDVGFGSYSNDSDGYYAEGNFWGFRADDNTNDGFVASNNGGDGIYSYGNTGDEGYFSGTVTVTGALSKGSGSFKIDHPLDPENKFLYHSFVESPDMMNVYNGNILLDENGEAIVQMEDWFQPLNRDFRYQLTAIGAPGPNLYIADKINNNQFKIAGGAPGMEVSWQVTGIRQDPYAEQNRIEVEVEKPSEFRGYYLHPEAYRQSFEKSFDYVKNGRKTLEEIESDNISKSRLK